MLQLVQENKLNIVMSNFHKITLFKVHTRQILPVTGWKLRGSIRTKFMMRIRRK